MLLYHIRDLDAPAHVGSLLYLVLQPIEHVPSPMLWANGGALRHLCG
jgi:hypothetical protein